MTNESWLSNVKGLNMLKLTAGYEISGNDDIDYYVARSYFSPQRYLQAISALTLAGIGNTNIIRHCLQRGYGFRLQLNGLFAANLAVFKVVDEVGDLGCHLAAEVIAAILKRLPICRLSP